jgi:hypothetical protein
MPVASAQLALVSPSPSAILCQLFQDLACYARELMKNRASRSTPALGHFLQADLVGHANPQE